jgi:radical SAM superfamily enzyme YgiQ (UPF0313 family)
LTADDTLMSDYHHNEFLGFGTCAPPNFVPDWMYRWLFFPPMKRQQKSPAQAPYGLRKVEAQLMKEGFSTATVVPKDLGEFIRDAKVLGVHVMDPFGLGPASTTLAFILNKEPFLAQYFRALMSKREIREAKDRGLKILVGGPGAWQFKHRLQFVEEFGIDCVVMGESENTIGRLVKSALNGEELPRFYESDVKESPDLDSIPDIVNPSVNGLVEIGRGCCRGCQFCSVTLRPLRWFPLDKIIREIDVNLRGGINAGCLHAEDVMLYGSSNTMPNEEKLLKLHEMVLEKISSLSWSHCSLAAVAAKPKLLERISEMVQAKGQRWWGAEIGIETGSAEVARKVMPAKALPFKAEEWPDVVRTGMGLMHDNMLVPAGTLIVGTPEETEDDLIKTIEIMDDVKDCRSLIVPLFFVPMGRLKDKDWFRETEMNKLHRELLLKCFEHDMRWIDDLIGITFVGNWYETFLRYFYRVFSKIARYKAKQKGIG